MTDSADMTDAAKRLQAALTTLEGSLSPLLSKVTQLEKVAADSQAFTQDRSRLAAELDVVKSQNEKLMARDAEFNRLADATTQEIDRVIADVHRALDKGA